MSVDLLVMMVADSGIDDNIIIMRYYSFWMEEFKGSGWPQYTASLNQGHRRRVRARYLSACTDHYGLGPSDRERERGLFGSIKGFSSRHQRVP